MTSDGRTVGRSDGQRGRRFAGFLLLALGCGGRATESPNPQVRADLARLREVTRPYRNLDAAVAAGYPRDVTDCIVHEHHGAMGYHHLNRNNLARDISVERPQFLLYERTPGGEYRLNGVEFIIPFRFWPRDTVAPVFMGQTMKPEDNFKYWYLHVWAWRDNPLGVFSDWHPSVYCSEAARKVYIASPP
jgi:hypothetical protein